MEVPRIPGLDFDPTGNELLSHYLRQRILNYLHSGDPNYSTNHHLIPDIELYNWDPEELPTQYNRLAQARSNGRQWFFFCLRKEKYRNSGRLERTVSTIGYWKITSLDTKITREHTGEEIGKKKLLTFYRGRTPNGIITSWGMHEYHLNPSCLGYNDTEEVARGVIQMTVLNRATLLPHLEIDHLLKKGLRYRRKHCGAKLSPVFSSCPVALEE